MSGYSELMKEIIRGVQVDEPPAHTLRVTLSRDQLKKLQAGAGLTFKAGEQTIVLKLKG